MGEAGRRLAPLVIVLLMLMLVPAAGAADKVTLTGVLAYDEEGAMILKVGQDVYIIDGLMPEDLIDVTVTITGEVETLDDGSKYLIVLDYEQRTS